MRHLTLGLCDSWHQMSCPDCGARSSLEEVDPFDDEGLFGVRECTECDARFDTTEQHFYADA